MSLRVVVRSPAETDLFESALFIAEDNPAAFHRVPNVANVFQAISEACL